MRDAGQQQNPKTKTGRTDAPHDALHYCCPDTAAT
jgi:hypothetical protein